MKIKILKKFWYLGLEIKGDQRRMKIFEFRVREYELF